MASGGSIDRYRHVREIARGGMGRVSEVVDEYLHRRVALKEIIDTDEAAQARFAREVEITARLEHPSIIPLYDAGFSEIGLPFYVMRQVTGRPLYDLVVAAGSLDERLRLVPHLLAVADAVAHAHQRGIIHRDLKPTNVLVGELGETVVIDWGLAKVLGEADPLQPSTTASRDDGLTVHGSVMGTPGFMPPEQRRGEEVDARADVYALGACLYNLLSGRLPPDPTPKTVAGGSEAPSPARLVPLAEAAPGVPAELVTIVERAMATDRAARYEDAGGVAEELRHFLGGRLVASHRYPLTTRLRRWLRRRAVLAVVTLALVAVAVIGVVSIRNVVEARREAERALEGEHQRSEELILNQATLYLASNPTLAVATLGQLPADSPNWDRAFPIAAQARASGVAVAYPGGGDPVLLVAGPHDRVASITSAGVWLIEPAEHRARLVEKAARWEVGWSAHHLVLFDYGAQQFLVIDPVADTRARVGLGPLRRWHAGGDLIAAVTGAGELQLLELAPVLGAWKPVAREVQSVWLSPTGTWMIVKRERRAELLRRQPDGTWSTRRSFDFTATLDVEANTSGTRVVIQLDDRRAELDVEHDGAELRTLPADARFVRYVGEQLYAMSQTNPTQQYQSLDRPDPHLEPNLGPVPVGGAVADRRENGRISLKTEATRTVIVAPGAVAMIAGRDDSPFLVGCGPEYIYVWDVRDLVGTLWQGPRAREIFADGSDHVVLSLGGFEPPPSPIWRTTLTGQREPFGELAVPLSNVVPVGLHFVTRALNQPEELQLLPGKQRLQATDVVSDGSDALIVASLDHRVERWRIDSGARDTLTRMQARIGFVGAREGAVVALDDEGRIWRRLRDGEEQQTALAAGTRLLGVHPDGTALLGVGPRLYVWPPRVLAPTLRATLADRIEAACMRNDAIVALTSVAAYRIGPAGDTVPVLPGGRVVQLSSDCRRVASLVDGVVTIGEVDTASHWQVVTSRGSLFALLRDGRSFVVGNGEIGAYQTYTIPELAELQAWVRTATNALPPRVGTSTVAFRPLPH